MGRKHKDSPNRWVQLDLLQGVPNMAPSWRPKVRADCAKIERPCPYVGCRYNMNLDILATGGIRWRQVPDFRPGIRQNCALDLAEKGPFTLDEIGRMMGVSRERIRQEVNEAFRKLREALPGPMLDDLLEHIDAKPEF